MGQPRLGYKPAGMGSNSRFTGQNNCPERGLIVITRDMIIAEILALKPDASEILLKSGMHCIGCPSSQMESLEDACMVHGISIEDVLEKLNA